MSRLTIAAVLLSVPGCQGQPPAAAPKYEVVSIKRCKPDSAGEQRFGQPISASGDRFIAPCAPVRALIQLAYLTYANGAYRDFNFFDVPIERAPGWIQSEFYTVEAKTGTQQSKGVMLGAMLRALLEDRFRLKIRRVNRPVPVYNLVVARGGSKLKPFDGSCKPLSGEDAERLPEEGECRNVAGGSGVTVTRFWRGISVVDLVAAVLDKQFVGRPVINKTGITGLFDIHLEFTPERDSGAANAGPSIFTAIQEQLGLRLVSARGVEEVLVIDGVERPEEN